jgi:hypothetical protein
MKIRYLAGPRRGQTTEISTAQALVALREGWAEPLVAEAPPPPIASEPVVVDEDPVEEPVTAECATPDEPAGPARRRRRR